MHSDWDTMIQQAKTHNLLINWIRSAKCQTNGTITYCKSSISFYSVLKYIFVVCYFEYMLAIASPEHLAHIKMPWHNLFTKFSLLISKRQMLDLMCVFVYVKLSRHRTALSFAVNTTNTNNPLKLNYMIASIFLSTKIFFVKRSTPRRVPYNWRTICRNSLEIICTLDEKGQIRRSHTTEFSIFTHGIAIDLDLRIGKES